MAWRNNWFGIRDTLTDVWEKHIKPILDLVIEWGKETLNTAWNWTVEAIGDFWVWLKDTAWPWLYKAGSTAWEWSLEALGTFWVWLRDTAWPWLSKAASTAWEWSIGAIGVFWEWLRDRAWPWIQGELETFWNWSFGVFGKFYTWLIEEGWPLLSDTLSTMWEWTLKVLGTFWEWFRDKGFPWLSKTAETLWEWTFKFLGKFFEWLITKAFPYIFEVVLTTWEWTFVLLGKFIIWLIETAFPFIGEVITTTWEWSFKALGKLWDWIQSGADWIGGTVSTTIEVGQKGLSAVKRGFEAVTGWLGFQAGGILPGISGPDMIPALLAPGEAVIPGRIWRQGIGAIAAWFKSAGVPGFQEGGIAGGGGLLGTLFPGLSESIEEQGGLIATMGSFIGDIPQMIVEGLVGGLDGLIDTMSSLAETVFGVEEAQRVTSGLESFRDQIMKMLIALGFFEGEVDEAAEAVKQAAKEQEEAAKIAAIPTRGLADAMEFLLGNIRQSMPLLNRAIDLFMQATADEIDAMGNVVQFGMNPLLALGLVVADVVMQSETFQRIMSIVNSILQAFADALGMALEPLLPLIQVLSQTVMPLLSTFGTILSALLVPVLQLLFPILKGFGVVILTLSQVIGRVWKTLLDLISLIPFVNLRGYKIDIDSLSEATKDLISLTWDEAMARSRNTEALEESTRVMVGVPSIFRIALRRAQAGSVGGPIPAMQHGGIVRGPTLALLGESGPEMVTPLSEGRTGGPVEITVNLNGPIFGMRDFQRAIEEAMGRAARSAGLAEHGVVVKFT